MKIKHTILALTSVMAIGLAGFCSLAYEVLLTRISIHSSWTE